MTSRRLTAILIAAMTVLVFAPTSAVQAQQIGRPSVAVCAMAQGTDTRICIIDGQIQNLEGQLRVARAAALRGVAQPRSMAGSIRTLEERLRALKARRALIVAGARRGVFVEPDEEDDDEGLMFLLPILAIALLMGAGGGSSGGKDGPPDVGGEPISPN